MVLNVFSFLIVIILFVLAYKHRQKAKENSMGFFLAGRSLSSLLFIATFIGTAFSTLSIVGVPGFFYLHGIGTWLFAFIGMSLLGIVGAFYGSRLLKLIKSEGYNTYSPIDIISLRYGNRGLGTLVAVVTVTFVVAHLAVQLVGIGRLIEGLTEGAWKQTIVIGVFLIIVVIYTLISGAEGVAWTDLLQSALVVGGMFCLGIVVLRRFDGIAGFTNAVRTTDPALLSLPGPRGFLRFAPLFSMTALLALASISQPRFSMRLMMTTDSRKMPLLVLVMIVLSFIVFTAALLVGLGGRIWNADLTSGDAVIGAVLAKLGPTTLFVPLFIVGVFCAAMSTIDSQLVAISGIITKDIFGNILPRQTETNELRRSKFIIVCVGLVAFFISLKPPELVLEMAFLALAGGTQLVPTYIGQFSARRSSLAAVLSIIIGLMVVLGGRYAFADKLGGFDPGIVGLVISSLTYFIVWRLGGTSHRA